MTEVVELLERVPQVEPLQLAPLSDQLTPSPEPLATLAVRVTESPGSMLVLDGVAMVTTADFLPDPPQPTRQLDSSSPMTANRTTRGCELRFMYSSKWIAVRAVDRHKNRAGMTDDADQVVKGPAARMEGKPPSSANPNC